MPDGEHLVAARSSRAIVREPADAVVITWGAMVDVAVAAAELVSEQRGAQVGVVDLRTLAPLDIDTIVNVAERAGRVVVVHEAPLTGGFGAEVVATIQEEAFYSLEAPIRRVAVVRRRPRRRWSRTGAAPTSRASSPRWRHRSMRSA